ncbi:MAG: S41 family peptidase [Cytophagales bacterium]|nr:S41 family peptidase [Cytophagales bacterium]
MRPVLFNITLFFSLVASAQSECGCEQELDFVISYYEKNLASFSDNVNDENRTDYELFKEDLRKEARTVTYKADCFRVLTYYVEFFKDNHASIRMRSEAIDESDEAAVSAFLASDLYQRREVYELTEADLEQYPIENIRGIYRIGDVYEIAIIPNKTPFRDYIGVILSSSSKLWKRGQIKLEIKQLGDNHYQAFSYLRNHSLRFSGRYKLKNGILGDSWVKSTKTDEHNYATNEDRSFHFKMLNDSIAYLRIPSFSGGYGARIDSLYQVADETIRQTPYLIVDVRDNGGGSDNNVSPLLPYIYTNPIKGDRVELLVTEDNLNLWKSWQAEWQADDLNYGPEQVEWISHEVARMERAKPGTWIIRSKGGSTKTKDVAKHPKSVAIIQNQYCASSCETLLFWAKESSRTILVGENSGGYVGYGENGGLNTPCYDFSLTCTMTRYEKQRKYEAEGVAPDYLLEYDRDWMTQTIELLGQE